MILAVLAAPGRCSAAADLQVGIGMATHAQGTAWVETPALCRSLSISRSTLGRWRRREWGQVHGRLVRSM